MIFCRHYSSSKAGSWTQCKHTFLLPHILTTQLYFKYTIKAIYLKLKHSPSCWRWLLCGVCLDVCDRMRNRHVYLYYSHIYSTVSCIQISWSICLSTSSLCPSRSLYRMLAAELTPKLADSSTTLTTWSFQNITLHKFFLIFLQVSCQEITIPQKLETIF